MSDDWPDRNEKRNWYDRGYKLGSVEARRDATFTRLIGAGFLFAGTVWDPLVTGAFLTLYAAFALLEWRDARDKADHLRELHDPGDKWDWGESDD